MSGYPQRHWDAVASTNVAALRAVGITGAILLLVGLGAVIWNWSLALAALAGSIFLYTLLVTLGSLLDVRHHVRVIPYFDREVGDIDTYVAGYDLARHLQPLDELATRLGVEPLSAFGFGDDLQGETVIWHPAESGLRTVGSLITAIEAEPGDLVQTLEDLRKNRDALESASRQDIRFSLLLLHGNATSAHEWEVRIGTAF